MRSDFTHWLYRGQRPNWIARMLNRAWATVASSGVASNYLVTLEVTGRKSGRTVSLPVVVAVVDGQRIASIRVPTLVIHAQDDTIQPYRNAEFFSSTIPGARRLGFQTGGHIAALIEAAAVGSAVQKHLLDNAGERHAQVPFPEAAEVGGES